VVYPGTALYEEAKRLKGVDDEVWETTRQEGLLVRDDPDSVLAYRRVDAALKEAAVSSRYTLEELDGHRRIVGSAVAPWLAYGEALEAAGEGASAETVYREILDFRPDSLWAHLRLGNLHEGRAECNLAAQHYRRAVSAVPRLHLAHSLLGSALRKMGKAAEAAREFRRALDLYPGDRVAKRGLFLLRRSKPAGAPRWASFRRKPSSALTAGTWPSFLHHPIPDGQPKRPQQKSNES